MGCEVKTDMGCQAKHGLWKSSVRTENIYSGADLGKLFFWALKL